MKKHARDRKRTIKNIVLVNIIVLSLSAAITAIFYYLLHKHVVFHKQDIFQQGTHEQAFTWQNTGLEGFQDEIGTILENIKPESKSPGNSAPKKGTENKESGDKEPVIKESGNKETRNIESSNKETGNEETGNKALEEKEPGNIKIGPGSTDIIEYKHGLVKLQDIDPTLVIDLKYATEDSFLGEKVYPENSVALLRKETALKLKKANEMFKKDGYRIKVWDAYRPLHVQQIFWDFMPDSRPISISLPSLSTKVTSTEAPLLCLEPFLGSATYLGFDDFSERAAHDYPGHTETALKNMKYLRDVMEKAGFKGVSTEWWHFDDADWEKYEVLDVGFEEF